MHPKDEVQVFDLSDPGLWIPAYHGINESKKRFKLLYGSRGRGASTNVAQAIVMRMLEEPVKGMMVRKVFEDIQGSQWETIRKWVYDHDLMDAFEFPKAPLGVICKPTGAHLIARGMNKPGRAKSVPGLSLAWYEEADELEEDDHRTTSLSIREDNIEEWLTFNSPMADHWIMKRFFPGTIDKDGAFSLDLSFESPDGLFTEVPSSDPNAIIVHGCYHHNPFTKPEYVVEMDRLAKADPETYRVDGLGLIGRRNLGSLWCRAFDRTKHLRKLKYRPDLPVHLTFDQNNLPYSTMLAIQIVPLEDSVVEIRVLKTFCYKPPSNSTEDLCAGFVYEFDGVELEDGTIAPSPEVYIYGDTTGRNETQKKERQELAHHYDAVKKHLAPYIHNRSMRVAASAPSIKGRQRFMTVLLNDGTFLRLVIDPSCKELIGDFEHLVEDENGGYIKKRVKDKETGQSWEEHGHCMDATINFIYQAFRDVYKRVAKV